MSKYIVSIFMLTYNQEQFIAQAIESILMQQTLFDYQLVIGEDCSNDETRKICEKYALEHPGKIKLLPALEKNIGLIANYMRTIKECDGKYIAICDGDDYWIDEYKLQKQVDFLENNPDFSIVYTALRRLYTDGIIKEYYYHLDKKVVDFDDLVFNNFIHSVSCLFKNKQTTNNQLPIWISKFPFGDWQTYLWTIRNGEKVYFLDEITAVYRMNTGISSQLMKKGSTYLIVLLDILKQLFQDPVFNHKKEIIKQSILNREKGLMTCYNREFCYFKGFKQYLLLVKNTDSQFKLTKLYLYSIYKSIVN